MTGEEILADAEAFEMREERRRRLEEERKAKESRSESEQDVVFGPSDYL